MSRNVPLQECQIDKIDR